MDFLEPANFSIRAFPEHLSFLCPVKHLLKWLAISGIRTGYVFRNVARGDRIVQLGRDEPMVSVVHNAYGWLIDSDVSLQPVFLMHSAISFLTSVSILACTGPTRSGVVDASGISTAIKGHPTALPTSLDGPQMMGTARCSKIFLAMGMITGT